MNATRVFSSSRNPTPPVVRFPLWYDAVVGTVVSFSAWSCTTAVPPQTPCPMPTHVRVKAGPESIEAVMCRLAGSKPHSRRVHIKCTCYMVAFRFSHHTQLLQYGLISVSNWPLPGYYLLDVNGWIGNSTQTLVYVCVPLPLPWRRWSLWPFRCLTMLQLRAPPFLPACQA